KKLVVCGELAFPEIALDTHHLTEALGAELEPGPIEIAVFRLHANRRLHAPRAAVATVDDPFEHAHVLTKARPSELSAFIGAEPVDVEDPGRVFHRAPHREPMPKIVADVITAERQHREGIPADFADLSACRCGRLRPHGRRL